MNDVILEHRRQDFIRQQLSLYGGEKKEAGNRVMVLCPYHSERTPSGSIWIGPSGPGYFRCFACKAKAPWDEVAPRLGLKPFTKGKPQVETSMDLLMSKALGALTKQERYRKDRFRFWEIPSDRKWRSISTNLLIQLDGKMCVKYNDEYRSWGTTKFLYFPVMVNGEQQGFFRARLRKDKSNKKLPSYLLAAAESGAKWALSHGLWPFDHSVQLMRDKGLTTMVLVEGQRDALRLISRGIPAVCIFGTQSWTANKAKLLEVAGVERIVLMMDGDDAGIEATEMLRPSLRSLFALKVIRLWAIPGSPYLQFADEEEPSKSAKEAGVDLWDPGNVPLPILNKIKAKYF